MEVLYISINIPAIIPLTIVTTIVFLMTKVLKCLRVMENMDIGILRISTLPLAITDFIIAVTTRELYLGLNIPVTLPLKIVDFIILVTVTYMDIGLKRPATLPLAKLKEDVMLTRKEGICIIPATLTPITQVSMAYC